MKAKWLIGVAVAAAIAAFAWQESVAPAADDGKTASADAASASTAASFRDRPSATKSAQTRRKMSDVLIPPKAKLFDIRYSTSSARPSPIT